MMKGPVIAMVAGEVSGDQIGGDLIEHIKTHLPDARFIGVTGPAMSAAGCETLLTIDDFSVMGILDVLFALPRIMRQKAQLHQQIRALSPDLFIGIDFTDFNLQLEKKLHRDGIKTLQYKGPSVWAWRPGRMKTMAKCVDIVLNLFPFEERFYQQQNRVRHAYIGHYLADRIPRQPNIIAARNHLGMAANKVLAIMPGSRKQEIIRLAEPFLIAALKCQRHYPTLQTITSVVKLSHSQYLKTLKEKIAPELNLAIFHRQSNMVLQACDAAMVCSGTVTLEAMLYKKPMVVAYRFQKILKWIYQRLIQVDHIALPNLLAQERLVTELVQECVTPQVLADETLVLLKQDESVKNMVKRFYALHEQLQCSAHEQAAHIIIEEIAR